MSNITRFDPMREMISLRNLVDDMFEGMLSSQDEGLMPRDTLLAVDMIQTADDVIIKAAMPGVKAENLHVSLANQVVTIRGDVKEDTKTENATYHIHERRNANFARSVQLPVPVVAEKAKAELEDGILVLTLPKAEDIRPKTITVKVK